MDWFKPIVFFSTIALILLLLYLLLLVVVYVTAGTYRLIREAVKRIKRFLSRLRERFKYLCPHIFSQVGKWWKKRQK